MKKILSVLIIFVALLSSKDVYADEYNGSKVIAGLEYYMVDTDLVITWIDKTVSYIDVSLTDTLTTEMFFKRTFKNKKAVIPVKDKDEVLLTISIPYNTPSSYIVNTQYEPKASVVYSSGDITNKDRAEVNVVLDDIYKIKACNNGEVKVETEFLQAGEYDIYIPLAIGNNEMITYIVDTKGNMKSFKAYVSKDNSAPMLTLTQDYDAIKTYNDKVTLVGNVIDFKALTINNVPVKVEANGNFSFDYTLQDGDNYITVSASDEAGNVANYNAVITKLIKTKNKADYTSLLILSVVIIAIIALVLLKLKKRKINQEETNDDDVIENGVQNEPRLENVNTDKKKKIISIITFFIPIIIIVGLYYICIYSAVVQSSSMEPTIKTKSRVFANKLAYIFDEPERGDVIAFYSKENKKDMLKRVIGVAGDKITFVDGEIFINGMLCEESYIKGDIETNADFSFIVPKGTVFVLGDNRENSVDSRYWNNPYVSIDDIYGKVFFNFK